MMIKTWSTLLRSFGLVVAVHAFLGLGMVVDLQVEKDSRWIFSIEQFGFLKGGHLSIHVKNFKFHIEDGGSGEVVRAGFVATKSESETEALSSLHQEMKEEYDPSNRICPFDDSATTFSLAFSSDQTDPQDMVKDIAITEDLEGLYDISFINCGSYPISFEFVSEMYNAGPNYLTAGETPTPSILFMFTVFFIVELGMWVGYLRRHKLHTHKVHHIMTALLVLKILAVFAQAVDYHYIKVYGSSMMWNFLYHILRALRAIMFFMVVILIGTGWSLLKPALNEKERKFLLFVLPLQVIANVALVIADELPEGSTGFMRWRDIFQLVDLLCCFAVAIPIFSHIQSLEKQTNIDGKAQINLSKLKQFRRFYLLVLMYVYFTRIIVFLLGNSVNFRRTYVTHIFRELAALLFYFFIGYSFRPTDQNAYLKLPVRNGDYVDDNGFTISDEDDEDPFQEDYFFNQDENQSEFGLGDGGDIEMTTHNRK